MPFVVESCDASILPGRGESDSCSEVRSLLLWEEGNGLAPSQPIKGNPLMGSYWPDTRFTEYERRDELLRSLGYTSYRSYIESELWTSIKARVRIRSTGLCEFCRKKRSRNVHHRSYSKEVLLGTDLTKLIDLCGGCHLKIEIIGGKRRRKRGFQKVEKMLSRQLAARDRQLIGEQPTVESYCSKCGATSLQKRHAWRRGKHPKCSECGGLVYRSQ